jgi:hypothetical protein
LGYFRCVLSIKRHISVALVLFINLIFALKYLPRYSKHGQVFAFMLVGVLALIYVLNEKERFNDVLIRLKKWMAVLGAFTIVLPVGLAILAQLSIPVEALNVDRWSVVDAFWSALRAGDYPYLAQSHMGNYPGPMPFYFVLCLPFYLFGELSYFSAFGYVLIGYFLCKRMRAGRFNLSIVLISLSAVYMLWEITTRSNIVSNSVLILGSFIYLESYDFKGFSTNKLIICSAMLGLMLSTRSVFALVYVIYFIQQFRLVENKKRVFILGFLSALCFVITFLPFIAAYGEQFFEINPFVIQSSFLIPAGYTLGFFVVAVQFGFQSKGGTDFYFWSGLSLFVAILIYLVYHWVMVGWNDAFYGSVVDISYFLLSLPFLIYFVLHQPESVKYNRSIDK